MCGIVGYVGHRDPRQVVLEGLRKLEYRGYDSSGIAVHKGDAGIEVTRAVGPVDDLVKKIMEIAPERQVAVSLERQSKEQRASNVLLFTQEHRV